MPLWRGGFNLLSSSVPETVKSAWWNCSTVISFSDMESVWYPTKSWINLIAILDTGEMARSMALASTSECTARSWLPGKAEWPVCKLHKPQSQILCPDCQAWRQYFMLSSSSSRQSWLSQCLALPYMCVCARIPTCVRFTQVCQRRGVRRLLHRRAAARLRHAELR